MHRSRGVALITALLVVATATTAAVAMAARTQLDIRRTANLLDLDQARAYARGGEGWAAAILREDRGDSQTDHLDEDWATQLPPLPIEGGVMTGHVTDLQALFNLNNVLREGKPSEPDINRLRRLLEQAGLDPTIADAIVDWVDKDQETRFPGGAEDDWYMNQTPGYRSASAPFASVTELRLVRGIDAAAYARLAPLVAALPAPTAINVNTAPAAIITALADGIDLATAEAIVADRQGDAFLKLDEFLALDALAGLGLTADGLSVDSRHFGATVQVQLGRARVVQYSVLARADSGAVRVLGRSYGDTY